ncbi:MAG: gamma-glutamylcyclotransferase (GGCT)/AIG2-like uncharacterized protein YtfP [Arcticibacterium sp.]|jgi:gamma-glutamylcyclotransferase (GGCT)/AIG2-like uncharacterized protein YtfP
MHYLFVYGMFMKKCSSNELSAFLQENAVYVDEASVEGSLYQIGLYPGLVKEKGTVYGEVYALNRPPETIAFLDEYEDYRMNDDANSLYLRESSMAKLVRTDKVIEAWVYYYNKPLDGLKKYDSGIFISH